MIYKLIGGFLAKMWTTPILVTSYWRIQQWWFILSSERGL